MTKQKIDKKKLLYIIHIIYDVLSALFIVFVSSALVINAIQNADKKTQDILTPNIQQEYKSRREHYRNSSGYYYYGTGDFLSSQFIDNWVRYLVSVGETWATPTSSQGGSITFDLWRDNGVSPIDVYYYNETNFTSTLWYNCRAVVFTKTLWNQSGDMSNCLYELKFSDVNGAKYVNFMYTLIRLTQTPGLYNYGVALYSDSGAPNGWDLVSLSHRLIVTENSSSSKSIFWPIFYDFTQGNYDSGYDNGYKAGQEYGYSEGYQSAMNDYQSGLNTAYSNGYEVGYDVGYIEGVDSDGVNAFGLIGQAFDAVSDVLSIEILPGFQLWVLVTTPLIIAVVIVVVKLIKG